MIKVFPVSPRAKPRMTRADSWKKRPIVQNFWAYRDELNIYAKGFSFPKFGARVFFFIPMPNSWPEKKKKRFELTPHQQKPDKDNLEKGFLDALMTEDKDIWHTESVKLWARQGMIVVIYEEQQ